MNVITMSILGAVLGALILMFFISLFTAEKIDLAGRIDREQVAEMADGGGCPGDFRYQVWSHV